MIGPPTGALWVGVSQSGLPVQASTIISVWRVVPSTTRSDAVTSTPPLPWRGRRICQTAFCFTGSQAVSQAFSLASPSFCNSIRFFSASPV